MRKILPVLVLILILTGCTSPRQMTLFSSKSSTISIAKAPSFVVAPNDILEINFTAVDSAIVEAYNSAGTIYSVSEKGTVEIPVLGQVELAGKNMEEATAYLTDLVKEYILNPIVRLKITNAAVTILGEVNKPARVEISAPIALPQAIGMVGGFTRNAQLKDILVQRSENNTITQYHVNLLTDEVFASPAYYLQKGDVVNVSPLRAQ